MPKPKSISQILGIGRGAFRKALLSMILSKYVQKDAFQIAIREFGEECIYCGSKNDLQADHLWPEEQGGIHVAGNVVPACPGCNSERTNKNWKEFMLNNRKKKPLNEEVQLAKIKKVEDYMAKYNMRQQPKLEDFISEQEADLREKFDLILDAITQGARAKAGNPQKKDIKFANPDIMFDEIIHTIQKYQLKV
jgi:hypothetical protein